MKDDINSILKGENLEREDYSLLSPRKSMTNRTPPSGGSGGAISKIQQSTTNVQPKSPSPEIK